MARAIFTVAGQAIIQTGVIWTIKMEEFTKTVVSYVVTAERTVVKFRVQTQTRIIQKVSMIHTLLLIAGKWVIILNSIMTRGTIMN